MIYEFKTYRASAGCVEALKTRFAEKGLPILIRLGGEVVHCWTSDEEPDAFFYLVRFPSDEARKATWAAFAADSEWKAVKGASEVKGPLLASQVTLALKPTAFSPQDRKGPHA
jgi:hypothetical protein